MGRNSSLSTESPWRVLCLLTFTGAAVTWYLCSWFSLWSLLLHFYVMRQACVVVVVVVVSCSAAAASLQSCPTLCDPIKGSPPDFPSLGFSKQEHWSGLPFPSPVHESENWKWSRSVVSDSSDLMDCSLPGSSIHGIFQTRVLEWGAITFSEHLDIC